MWDGKEIYLENSFEVSEMGLISFDCGYDLEINEWVWGFVVGVFYFVWWQSFVDEVSFQLVLILLFFGGNRQIVLEMSVKIIVIQKMIVLIWL